MYGFQAKCARLVATSSPDALALWLFWTDQVAEQLRIGPDGSREVEGALHGLVGLIPQLLRPLGL
jgi:hypothetical protein